MSACEAVGYAKLSGRVGVCAAASGPGAVVATVGQIDRSAMGGSYQQEVDLLSLYRDFASDFCDMVTVPEQLPNVLDRAMRMAMARRSVTALIIPADVLPYVTGSTGLLGTRPAIALVGDGAMQMNGLAELITIAKYRQDREDPRLIVAVLDNRDLNQVTWEMRATGGTPRFLASQSLPDVRCADFATSPGLTGMTIDEPGMTGGAWEAALAADRQCSLDFVTDPAVPPIPPHATLDRFGATASAVLKPLPRPSSKVTATGWRWFGRA